MPFEATAAKQDTRRKHVRPSTPRGESLRGFNEDKKIVGCFCLLSCQ